MTVRADLAAAVTVDTAIDGEPVHVTGYQRMPDTVTPFDAWPAWSGDDFVTDCHATETWRVLVALPAGAPDVWVDAGDTLRGDIGFTLSKFGRVTAAPVQLLVAQGSPQPALQFTVTI
jgi:hypothetical protein